MENQKINLNKLANSNNNSNSRNNTYFNQSQEIQPQFGETQIHPKKKPTLFFAIIVHFGQIQAITTSQLFNQNYESYKAN